jgi:hypothetical protein
VIGGQSLYFLDREEGDDEGIASIFATPLDASAPVPVARHLKSPRLLGILDGSLYFDDASSLRALFRTRSDSSIEKVAMPSYVMLSIGVASTRFATVGGAGYLSGTALYRLPNDAGTSLRDVVLRLRPDSDKVEVAHCFPDWTVNRDKFVSLIDLAASDSQLYLARSIRDLTNDTWEDEILELAP